MQQQGKVTKRLCVCWEKRVAQPAEIDIQPMPDYLNAEQMYADTFLGAQLH